MLFLKVKTMNLYGEFFKDLLTLLKIPRDIYNLSP